MSGEETATVEETEEETTTAETEETEDTSAKPDLSKEVDKWKALSRKNEKELEKARKALKEREDADKSEQEKAIEKAREEARSEALSEAEKDRRADRLDAAVTRLAAKGVKVGDGDDAKTMKFADPEDALAFLQRGDTDGLFDDDGKVDSDALTEALVDLAKRKPHLTAEGKPGPSGDADTRRGETANTDLEAMSPEDHAKRKYGNTK